MNSLCEYGAVIEIVTKQLTPRKPVLPSLEPNAMSTAIQGFADDANRPPQSSVFVTIITDAVMCGEALPEGSVQILPEKEIGIARGVTDLQEERTTVLMTNLPEEAQHVTECANVGYVAKLQAPVMVTAIFEKTSFYSTRARRRHRPTSIPSSQLQSAGNWFTTLLNTVTVFPCRRKLTPVAKHSIVTNGDVHSV